MMQPSSSHTLLDRLTTRWWFYLIVLILFFLPAYSQIPYDPRNTPQLVIEVLSHATAYAVPPLFPLLKLAPAALVLLLWVRGAHYSRPYYGYAAANLLIIAVFQTMGRTPSYGFAWLVGNAVVYGLVGVVWAWEAMRGPVPLCFQFGRYERYWVIPLALLAFWFPVNTSLPTPAPDFSPWGLAGNEAGFTFCMILPVYLGVLILAYPSVRPGLFRLTAFVGFVTGLLNVTEFFLNPSYGLWLGVLHLPLLLISTYALWLGWRKNERLVMTPQAG